ncbi:MAG: hypothetical protein P4L10_07425 [Acidobacteriaceae bacterium]|nr:hypothetical protein [Acidobacteriaceae bacterium]
MKMDRRILILCIAQLAVVSTIAAKYLYERHTCPRVWVQVTQYDPETIMRGRYLALQPMVDACGLDKTLAQHTEARSNDTWHQTESWEWIVRLVPTSGTLVPVVDKAYKPDLNFYSGPSDDDGTYRLTLSANDPCTKASVRENIEFFVAEKARSPFPLPSGTEVWLSATIPPKGPPRALQLALKQDGVLTPLKLN